MFDSIIDFEIKLHTRADDAALVARSAEDL